MKLPYKLRHLWRPRSLYQVALLGILVVWIPLVVTIAYTGYRFDEQAVRSSIEAEKQVTLTRANQQLRVTVLELERRAGQFLVLRDSDIKKLFQDEHARLKNIIKRLQNQLPGELKYQLLAIEDVIDKLQLAVLAEPSPNNQEKVVLLFQRMQASLASFQKDSSAVVDQQLSDAVNQAAEDRLLLIIMTAVLSLVTLLAAWFFIQSITRPVRQLEREIQRLGGGDLQRPIQISGPDEMRRLSEQLDWLRTQLAEIDSQKQQFLRHMSHELKTPLASLREGADLMAEEVTGPLEPQQQEIVAIMRHNSVELQRLIENLLDYNQMLQQRQLHFTEVNIGSLLAEVLRRYGISVRRKELQVKVETDETLVVLLDKTKATTIIDNMVSNAVNYSYDSGEILIKTGVNNNRLWVQVANQGDKILAQESAHIFDAFYQGSQTRKGAIKGSGIGLAVARECAEIHEGSLKLINHDNYAVCFLLELQLGC